MHRGILSIMFLVLAAPLGAQGMDEASLEARFEALNQVFSPMARAWGNLTAQGAHLLWEAGFFKAFEGDAIVILQAPLVEIAESARNGERLAAPPSQNRKAPPPVVALPLSEDAAFVTSSGRHLSRERLNLSRDQLVAVGRHPETGKVVMVVVLEEPTLQTLGEQYGRKLQEFTAQE